MVRLIKKGGIFVIMESIQSWFDELYMKHSKKMVRIAVRLGFSEEDGEDIMQDAFLLLLSKAEIFQTEHNNPAAFLYVTQKHLLGDAIRERNRQNAFYAELPEIETMDTYFPSLKDSLVPGLSEMETKLLIAYYDERASYQEISYRFGIPEAYCRVKVFRAKNHYRKILLGVV